MDELTNLDFVQIAEAVGQEAVIGNVVFSYDQERIETLLSNVTMPIVDCKIVAIVVSQVVVVEGTVDGIVEEIEDVNDVVLLVNGNVDYSTRLSILRVIVLVFQQDPRIGYGSNVIILHL